MKKTIVLGFVFLLALALFIMGSDLTSATSNVSVCCEKTTSGLYCQNVPEEQCSANSRKVPSSCESTSFCKPGVCYDSDEGNCASNTPQLICNLANGTWSADKNLPQCNLGCCILGDQAAFVSLVRCKKLSATLGLETNFNKNIQNEIACVLVVQNQDKGACVYESEFERACKVSTRAECLGNAQINGTSVSGRGEFFKGKLCTAPELATKCARTKRTTCVPGKDGVYFVDTCGNPGNVYDSSKVDDSNYWTDIKDSAESCNSNGANINSASCGNCNYLLGSVCRNVKDANANANYGNNICADLNCKSTQNGNSYKHGESWCVYNDAGTNGKGDNSVGSRYYKHICINGEEIVEQCGDFRQQECVEDKITTSLGTFAQASCRVNRWQDCTAQDNKQDCENNDRRDCLWMEGITVGSTNPNTTIAANTNAGTGSEKSGVLGACVPKVTPGLKFWEGEEAKAICNQGSYTCNAVFEKGLFGGESCVKNCECLAQDWLNKRVGVCKALGDCGPKVNWINDKGYKAGYNYSITKAAKAK